MHLHHSNYDLHHPHTHLIRLHGLWGMYWNMIFRRLSSSMVGLFIPIYIYEKFNSFDHIFYYYFLAYLVGFIFVYPSAKNLRKIGVNWGLFIGSLFRIILTLFLFASRYNPYIIYASAFFYGLTLSFDWIPYHYVIISLSQKKGDFGKNNSIMEIFVKLSSATGPLLGGLIITQFGFSWLYVIGSIILMFAGLAPFFDDFDKRGMHLKFIEIEHKLKDPGILKHIVGHTLNLFELNTYTIVWPMILFASFGSVTKSGGFQSIMLLISVILLWWLKDNLDKGKFGIMKLGSASASIHWLVRALWNNPIGFLISEMFYNFEQLALWVPFGTLVYSIASHTYKLEFLLIRALIRFGAGALIVVFLYLIYKIFNSIYGVLYFSSVIMLSSFFIESLFKQKIKSISKNEYE